MKPTLRFGARGDDVESLQGALNLWEGSKLSVLEEDGIFGGQTHGKVLEFQREAGLVQDGIVGPNTWKELAPLIDDLLNLIQPPGDDIAAGQRIVATAQNALAAFGWSNSTEFNVNSPRVAAAFRADKSHDPGPRQGGNTLQHIFMVAGAGPSHTSNCPIMRATAEPWWQKSGKEATYWRNQNDLPSWCGIFTFFVYRSAGIDLPKGWMGHTSTTIRQRFDLHQTPKRVKEGSIGVINPTGGNHHFIVVRNDVQGKMLHTIDGNAHGPVKGDYSRQNHSVIATRHYSYSELTSGGAYFMFRKL